VQCDSLPRGRTEAYLLKKYAARVLQIGLAGVKKKNPGELGPLARAFLSELPAQIHTTFAFLLPYCSSLLMIPCGLRI